LKLGTFQSEKQRRDAEMAHLTGNAVGFFAKNQDLKERFSSLKMKTMNQN